MAIYKTECEVPVSVLRQIVAILDREELDPAFENERYATVRFMHYIGNLTPQVLLPIRKGHYRIDEDLNLVDDNTY